MIFISMIILFIQYEFLNKETKPWKSNNGKTIQNKEPIQVFLLLQFYGCKFEHILFHLKY